MIGDTTPISGVKIQEVSYGIWYEGKTAALIAGGAKEKWFVKEGLKDKRGRNVRVWSATHEGHKIKTKRGSGSRAAFASLLWGYTTEEARNANERLNKTSEQAKIEAAIKREKQNAELLAKLGIYVPLEIYSHEMALRLAAKYKGVHIKVSMEFIEETEVCQDVSYTAKPGVLKYYKLLTPEMIGQRGNMVNGDIYKIEPSGIEGDITLTISSGTCFLFWKSQPRQEIEDVSMATTTLDAIKNKIPSARRATH